MLKTSYSFIVQWGETDAAGIVFYPNFYKWMDNATHELFASIGHSMARLFSEEKIGIPILEAGCSFKRPVFFRDRIEVQTEVAEIREKVFKLEHVFFRDGIELARGYEVRAWTSFRETPKAVPIPEEIRRILERGI
ncbi:thioesterase family protein [Bacillaceae bacterium]